MNGWIWRTAASTGIRYLRGAIWKEGGQSDTTFVDGTTLGARNHQGEHISAEAALMIVIVFV